MEGNTLVENTAKWLLREWKDDFVFPNYLVNVPKELKQNIVRYYITWALRSCDLKKAFFASKLFGEEITESELKDAKDYIIKNGKYACEEKYLTKEDLINLDKYTIKISKSEALDLFRLQTFTFNDLAGVLDFFGEKDEALEVYLSLYSEMCELAIQKRDLTQFSYYFPMLLEFPIPEEINSLLPKVNSFHIEDAEKLFRKFNKAATSFKKKTISNLNKKVDNWFSSILTFYPLLIKEKKDFKYYYCIPRNIIRPYLINFKYSKTTVDKIGHLLISNNFDIDPLTAIECFNASNNKKMKKRLEVFSIDEEGAAESFSQEKLERILKNALGEADLFLKEKLYLLAFELLQSAQSLVETNERKVLFINDIIEKKIKLALYLLKTTEDLPGSYYLPDQISSDIEKIGKNEYYTEVLNQILMSKSHRKRDFVSEFFSKCSHKKNLFSKEDLERFTKIKPLLKRQELQNNYKREEEINENKLCEDLDKSDFHVTNQKYSEKLGIIRKISGDFIFKRLYNFIENTALLKEQIMAIDLYTNIPMDNEQVYSLEVPMIREEKSETGIIKKKNDPLITFDNRPRIHRFVEIKLADATPLQKKLIKYQMLKHIKMKNWRRVYMCYWLVPKVDRASYYFEIIEKYLREDMKIERIDSFTLHKFKNQIDKEIIRVFLIYQSKYKSPNSKTLRSLNRISL